MTSVGAVLLMTIAFAARSPVVADTIEYRFAVARRGCTQEDAPALEIYLTQRQFAGVGQPPIPHIRIELAWTDWVRLTDTTLTLAPLSRRGLKRNQPLVRAELNRAEHEQEWLTGTLVLRRIECQDVVEGSYDFAEPGDRRLRGTFSAKWVAGTGGCG